MILRDALACASPLIRLPSLVPLFRCRRTPPWARRTNGRSMRCTTPTPTLRGGPRSQCTQARAQSGLPALGNSSDWVQRKPCWVALRRLRSRSNCVQLRASVLRHVPGPAAAARRAPHGRVASSNLWFPRSFSPAERSISVVVLTSGHSSRARAQGISTRRGLPSSTPGWRGSARAWRRRLRSPASRDALLPVRVVSLRNFTRLSLSPRLIHL